MDTYIALFRGINGGGRNRLPMRELVGVLEVKPVLLVLKLPETIHRLGCGGDYAIPLPLLHIRAIVSSRFTRIAV